MVLIVGPLSDGHTNMLVYQMKNGVITLNEFLDGIMSYYKNSGNDEFSLKGGTTLVSANKQSTCESRELKGLFL